MAWREISVIARGRVGSLMPGGGRGVPRGCRHIKKPFETVKRSGESPKP